MLVPVIPTKEMVEAGDEIISLDGKRVQAESVYDAMVNGCSFSHYKQPTNSAKPEANDK